MEEEDKQILAQKWFLSMIIFTKTSLKQKRRRLEIIRLGFITLSGRSPTTLTRGGICAHLLFCYKRISVRIVYLLHIVSR